MSVSREDVVECFRTFLRREPESEASVNRFVVDCASVWDVIWLLINSDEFQFINHFDPRAVFKKYGYIARNLTQKQKCDCHYYNFTFLCRHMSEAGYAALTESDPIIFESCPGRTLYHVSISISREHYQEGELSLTFSANGIGLFVIAFSIVPGFITGERDHSVLLIGRMQGKRSQFELVRRATKEMGEVAPQQILFSALQGVALALGIDCIAGVAASNQITYKVALEDFYRQAYDEFFIARGASGGEHGFFRLRLSEDAARPATPGRRRRTERRRQIRAEVVRSVKFLWSQMFGAGIPADGPACPALNRRA